MNGGARLPVTASSWWARCNDLRRKLRPLRPLRKTWTPRAGRAEDATLPIQATSLIRRLIPPGVRRWVKGRVRASLDRLLSAQTGRRVLQSPFGGVVISEWSSRGPSVQFLVGTHESELHP